MLKSVIIDDEVAARKSLEKIIELYLGNTVKVEGSAETSRVLDDTLSTIGIARPLQATPCRAERV